MSKTRTSAICVLTCAGLLLGAPSARAQNPPDPPGGRPGDPPAPAPDLPAQAAERKKAGDQAMDALRYADALTAYGDAFAITHDPALLYNMGRALQALGRYPEALDKPEAFDAAAASDLKARVPRLAQLVADLRQRVTTLTVRTNVAGARILVRNTVIGKSPLPGPVRLTAGPADVEIEAEGYFPGKRSVVFPGGSALDLDVDLFSRDTTGVLSVRASLTGAEVLVDDKRIGIAPIETNVSKGTHRIVVRKTDYRPYETSVVIPAGGSKSVLATLETSSVVTRWWFWGGVGAVVATGIVVTIAAVSERSPDSGTIAPGQLTKSIRTAPPLFRF